jgi:hypothetical protein
MRATLVTEGSSDRALVSIIMWALNESGVQSNIETTWADLSNLPSRPRNLADKVRYANELFPCELMIVHRDSDGAGRAARVEEINGAVGHLLLNVPHVCIIPVRMLEAWLLFDEQAIRKAAGNPYGTCELHLPNARETEREADPKHLLFEQLRIASELTGRRLKKFDRNAARAQIAEFVDDFSPLRQHSAFCDFERDLQNALTLAALQAE